MVEVIISTLQVPYSTLHPSGNSTVLPQVRQWHTQTQRYHLVDAYGLFRRMTGVEGRPEVIIEGSNSIDGPWKEYHFLYKPGNVNATLPFVGKILKSQVTSHNIFSFKNVLV